MTARRYDFSGLVVLVVDDNAFMRAMLRRILMQFGCGTVQEAADGNEALARLRTGKTDIVLCDWLMQPMDGHAFLTRLRRDRDHPARAIPVIMVSGQADREHLRMARDGGITEFLAKPVSPENLLHALLAAIDCPRPFIEAPGYVGPDRRRRDDPDAAQAARRQEDLAAMAAPSVLTGAAVAAILRGAGEAE